jgi:Flp pilus assembly protein TadD
MGNITHRKLMGLCLAGLLTACASDPLTSSVKSGKQSTKAETIVRMAEKTAARGDWPIAASLFRNASKLDSGNFDAVYGLARALNKLNANEEALSIYRRAIELRPKDANALRGIGNTLVYLDRSALAIPKFELALEQTEDPRVFNGMGVAFDMLDDYKAAQAYYRVGLKIAPQNPSLRNNLALSLLLTGNASESAALLKELAASRGATTRHRLNYALSLVLSGDTRMAERVVRMDLDKESAEDQITFFETIKSLGKTKAARAAIRAHINGTANSFMHPRRKTLTKLPNR